ncbi:hypothetical protein MPER_09984, partial [Moniliophthora perniciosa FA553]
SAGASPRVRRRTIRTYTGPSPSPLRKTGTVIKTVGSNLRRMSLRVVNLRGAGLENQIRLDDEVEKEDSGSLKREEGPVTIPAFGSNMPLRGRTICCLGPNSRLRLAMYNFLIHPFTEPVILLLIIVNAVVLTIQGARSLALADDNEAPPRIKGYFQAWEDYVLFALFVVFSVEALARICVSGFLFDPDIPTSTFFTAPLSSHPDMPVMAATQTTVPTSSNLARQASLTQGAGGPLSRGLTLTQRLDRLQMNLKRPWTQHSPDNGQDVEELAVPTTKLESYRFGRYSQFLDHLCVGHDRTARLLTITSGTTTIMHSLKTARPLLTSVAYFFVFAMMLFSIIGVQSFKGSFRRSCSLLGVNGEEEIQLEQFCGGFVDSATMQAVPFLMSNGEPSPSEPKGYICPLGQICKENEINPNNNVESFDTIYYAAFQVIVAATANGWTPVMYSMIDSQFFRVESILHLLCHHF